jgi:hypothetical protein
MPAFRRLLLCVALQASIQMTGVSAIQYYSTIIFVSSYSCPPSKLHILDPDSDPYVGQNWYQ